MAWAFQPINDICLDCDADIDPKAERNYIVWEPPCRKKGKLHHSGRYRRQCAICHDKQLQRPYNRRSTSDSIIMGHAPEPTITP